LFLVFVRFSWYYKFQIVVSFTLNSGRLATLRTFEEVEAWKKSRALAQRIYLLTREGSFSKDFGLKDQINRSTGSVMDNIAEGFERDGSREFIQFLSIAKASMGEAKSQLYRALDREHISENDFQDLIKEATQVGRLISGLMNYLHQSGFKGNKFKSP
jgi:four helix bundle protein